MIRSKLHLGWVVIRFLVFKNLPRKMKRALMRLTNRLHVKKRLPVRALAPAGPARGFVPQFPHVVHEIVIRLGIVRRVVTGFAQHRAPRQIALGQIGHGGFAVILESRARRQKRRGQRGPRYGTDRAARKCVVKCQPILGQRLDIRRGRAVAVELQVCLLYTSDAADE